MKTDVFSEVYDANGNLIRKSEFKSNYKSPSLYPHPGEEKITEKPSDWSHEAMESLQKSEWDVNLHVHIFQFQILTF